MAKKLIEVAPFLPLDAISTASKADKDKKTGTIKNVHKWFAPMPTPALRALIFAAVVDAPDSTEETAELLRLVELLVPPDGNPPSREVLDRATEAIKMAGPNEGMDSRRTGCCVARRVSPRAKRRFQPSVDRCRGVC